MCLNEGTVPYANDLCKTLGFSPLCAGDASKFRNKKKMSDSIGSSRIRQPSYFSLTESDALNLPPLAYPLIVKIFFPRSQSGFSLLSVVFLTLLVSAVMWGGLTQMNSARKSEIGLNQQVIAQMYASELLELFRAFNSSTALLAYLRANPVNNALSAYYFCSHINILDRTTGEILNRDPLADLPINSLDSGAGALAANRFYMIQVVDAEEVEFNPSALCGAPANYETRQFDDPALAAAFTPNSSFRLLVTVGVSWVPHGKTLNDQQELVLTTILPVN